VTAKKREDSERRFEDLLEELLAVVTRLEKAEPDLEDALLAYERGMALSRECHKRLEEAQQKIKLLRQRADGSVEEAPFAKNDTERR